MPRGETLLRLATTLGVTTEWFRDGTNDPSTRPGELSEGNFHFHLPVMPPGSAMTLTLPGGQIVTLLGHLP